MKPLGTVTYIDQIRQHLITLSFPFLFSPFSFPEEPPYSFMSFIYIFIL